MKAQVILKRWRARITRAQKRGKFTSHDISLSYDWEKCAVGERDCMCEKVIPRDDLNITKSDIVRNNMFFRVVRLGSRFHSAVGAHNFKEALQIIKQIESIPKKRFYK